jgi:hypothetical protein
MNRAEYEAVNNRIAAVEARCELLEQQLRQFEVKASDFDAAVRLEQERTTLKARQKSA